MRRSMANRATIMMWRTTTLTPLTLAWLCLAPASAADLKLLPTQITLTGGQAHQHLLVLAEVDGQYVGDRTSQAQFVSSNPAVAVVNEAGIVQAQSDGEAVIT